MLGWQAGAGRGAPVSEKALEAAGVSIQEAPYRLNDLIGYHEVGHVVIWEYGLRQPQSWFDEMLATFAAYAFLRDRYAGEARVWDALMQRRDALRSQLLHPLQLTELHPAVASIGVESHEELEGSCDKKPAARGAFGCINGR